MKYNESFIKTLNCLEDYETVGLGNPNSKILLVGKEASNELNTEEEILYIKENLKAIHGSAFQWKSNKYDYSYNPNELRKLSDTWKNYQQLLINIYENEKDSQYATFLKKVFTTEMSNFPSKTTEKAKKKSHFKIELENRKKTFFKSDFIQSFPVVVLACSDYIENNETNREIDSIFGVKYSGEYKEYSKGNWFFIHYNESKTKLVIHTRQLSANVNNDLLLDMGKLIQKHLIKLNLFNETD
jgi:hypothetical protein